VIGDAGMWIIGTDIVAPGATVTIPVTVTGDKNGINSYIMKMGQDAGPVANTASAGDAYGDLNFVFNLDGGMTFAGTNNTLNENIIPADGATVFYVTFTAPTEPGKYNLTFDELSVFDINMSELTPLQQNGWIEVVAESTTTEATETTTEESETTTEATETTTEESETTTEATETTTEESETTTEATETTTEESETTTEATETTTGESETTTEATETTTEESETTTEATETTTGESETTTEATETTTGESETTTEATETSETETSPEVTETTTEVTETTTEATETETTTEATETQTTESTETTETTATTAETDVPPATETTTEDLKPAQQHVATWTIGKKVVSRGQSNVQLPISVTADIQDALTYCAYDFNLTIADGPEFVGAESGEAYAALGVPQVNLVNPAVGAEAAEDVAGFNNATIVWLTFNIPADIEPGIYPVSFNMDNGVGVIAHNMGMIDEFDITEVDGYIQVLPDDVKINTVEYQYDVETNSKFYFSHDTREFKLKEDLLSLGTLKRREVLSDEVIGEDGQPTRYGEWTIANDLSDVEFLFVDDLTTPEKVFDATYPAASLPTDEDTAIFVGSVPFKITTHLKKYNAETQQTEEEDIDTLKLYNEETGENDRDTVTGDIYIGVKGDMNLNGEVRANDAALALVYAAGYGAGVEVKAYNGTKYADKPLIEDFVYFLTDVDGESEDHDDADSPLNAKDAGYINVHAAREGSGMDPDWYYILGAKWDYETEDYDKTSVNDADLPKHTREIGPADAKTNSDQTA